MIGFMGWGAFLQLNAPHLPILHPIEGLLHPTPDLA